MLTLLLYMTGFGIELHISYRNLPTKLLNSAERMFSQTFYPNITIFYTDLFAKFVTFRISAGSSHKL